MSVAVGMGFGVSWRFSGGSNWRRQWWGWWWQWQWRPAAAAASVALVASVGPAAVDVAGPLPLLLAVVAGMAVVVRGAVFRRSRLCTQRCTQRCIQRCTQNLGAALSQAALKRSSPIHCMFYSLGSGLP